MEKKKQYRPLPQSYCKLPLAVRQYHAEMMRKYRKRKKREMKQNGKD